MPTHHYKKTATSGDSLEFKVVFGIMRGIWAVASWPFRAWRRPTGMRRRASAVDAQDVAKRWADVQTLVGLGGTTHFGSAVVSADKLLDYVLRRQGYAGETMAERLSSARSTMTPSVYAQLWQAHKLRNVLVHEVGGEVMALQAKEAIQSYENALRDLGVLR